MSSHFFSQAGFLQFEIAFGDPPANLAKVESLLYELAPSRKAIIALPELWAYGFDYSNTATLARETSSLLLKLKELAAEMDVILAGSLLETADEGVYNSLYFVGPGGVLGTYRKQHLFSAWQEDDNFARGGTFEPISTPQGLVGGLVCYDLRFPELARKQAFQGVRLLIVSAEWPAVRIDHWQILLTARAIEDQVFVVACNSYGTTGEHTLGGHSMVIGPDGSVLAEAGNAEESRVVDLDACALTDIRSKFCPPGESLRPVQDSGKLVSLDALLEKLAGIKQQKGKVGFTNGCFDILHSGHVAYLEHARSEADCLVVGLNSDSSVKSIKGPGRPVNKELDRARILSSLACVDYVVIFDEDTPHKLITAILPDVLVKGADWEEGDIVGAREVKEAGGKVVRIAFEHDVSTTGLITRIQSRS